MYYMCTLGTGPISTEFRVSKESYELLTTEPYYQDVASCREPEVRTNKACYCPSGYTGHLCKTKNAVTCFVQITDPNMAAGCSDQYEDSDDYVYSIQGYDPCHFFDFDEKTTIKYRLTCRAMNAENRALETGYPERVGFEYIDLVDAPSTLANPITLEEVPAPGPIVYVAENPVTGYKLT